MQLNTRDGAAKSPTVLVNPSHRQHAKSPGVGIAKHPNSVYNIKHLVYTSVVLRSALSVDTSVSQ